MNAPICFSMRVHVCGLVNDTVSSGDYKHQKVGWIQIWKDVEGSNHSPIWCTIPTISWIDWDKLQDTWFRIVSLWAQIWIQTSRIQSRSADTSTVMFVPDFYHLSLCYTWQGLLVLHAVWSVTWVQFCRLCCVTVTEGDFHSFCILCLLALKMFFNYTHLCIDFISYLVLRKRKGAWIIWWRVVYVTVLHVQKVAAVYKGRTRIVK